MKLVTDNSILYFCGFLSLLLLQLALPIVVVRARPDLATLQMQPRVWRKEWGLNFTLGWIGLFALGALTPWVPFESALNPIQNFWQNTLHLPSLKALPFLAQVFLVWVAMDAAEYFVHRAMHAHPWGWKIHRLHHTGSDFEISKTLRAHPLDFILVFSARAAFALLMGSSREVWTLAEGVSGIIGPYLHFDLGVPLRTWFSRQGVSKDGWFGILSTPETHRVHHASKGNFGSALLIWDKLFGTYRSPPSKIVNQ